MPQSLAAIYLHAVFSTKERMPFLENADIRANLHAYLAGVSKNHDCPAIEVGGVADHIHMVVRFGRTITVADWLREIKRASSIHVKETQPSFSWQAGYGVFGVEASNLPQDCRYVRNQDEHHRTRTFQDELRQLMTENGVEWDERYIWD